MERISYIDSAKVIAIIAVVALHVSASLFYQFTPNPSSEWWIGNVVDSICRWGVPIFLMCSGVVMLSKQKAEHLHNFFKKRFVKIVIPLIGWSFIYVLWKYRLAIDISIVEREAKLFISGASYYHLNFLYYLLGLYLITPVLRVFISNADKSTIEYFIGFWLLATTGYSYFAKITHLSINIPLTPFSGYIGYYVLGYYLHTFPIRRTAMVFYFCGMAGLGATILGTFFLCQLTGAPNEYFYGYLNLTVIMMATAVFIFIKSKDAGLPPNFRLSYTSGLAFGIYLIHPIVLELLAMLGITANTFYPIIGIPLTTVLVLIISSGLVLLLKKNKLTRMFAP